MRAISGKASLLLTILILAAALVTIITFVAAQPNPIDPLDPPAPDPTPAPSDWLTPGRIGRHLDVVPVSQNKIPLHQIALPRPQQPELIKSTADGGCLAIQTVAAPVAEASSGVPHVHLRAIRYKADGSVLWDRTDTADRFEGYPVSMCVWTDGSYAIGLHRSESTSGAGGLNPGDTRIVAHLLRYAMDGTRTWSADVALTPAGSLEHIFALADGFLLTAGVCENAQANGVTLNQIRLQRFAADGRRVQQKSLALPGAAETGHQMILDASCVEGIGLALAWRSIPAAQTTIGQANSQAMVLTMLDQDLNEKWSHRLADGIGISNLQVLPDRFGILALGSQLITAPAAPPTDNASGTSFVSTLFHCDAQGIIDWSYAASEPKSWLLAAGRTIDGQYVVGEYRTREDGSETTTLLVFSANGQDRRELAEIPGHIQQIAPKKDGGFTAVLQQAVRALPQPPFISSLWTDTEAIVCQYNRRLQLAWRRSIDQYKHTMRSDLIIVTAQDRLLVG